MLVPSDGNIFVIGDLNQAIYGFRGGDAKFFNSFTEDYPDTKIVNLKIITVLQIVLLVRLTR